MRTFEFQPGKAGADAWLKMQAKYGAGNEIMGVLTQHIDHMASTIALHEIFGPTPDAAFEAAVRLAKEKNPSEALAKGLRWFDSELVARNTFNEVTAMAPLRHELFDKQGRRATSGTASEVFKTLERWTPNTWYTKLAVDRLFWEELQSLLDPHWRDSFKRANQAATRKGGAGYWFAPGAAVE